MLSDDEIAARRLIACPTFVIVDDSGIPTGLVKTSNPDAMDDNPNAVFLDSPQDFNIATDNIDMGTKEVIKNARTPATPSTPTPPSAAPDA